MVSSFLPQNKERTMSDNRERYRTIKQSLKQLYPYEPTGNQARHLNTLAALISGIVGSRSCQLPDIASKVPDGNKKESRVKRYTRWLQNERITSGIYFLPYAAELLATLATAQSLLLAIDGSEVGRGCMALMISVIYKQRALPLVWVVVAQAKGHLVEDLHVQLVEQVYALVPADADVIMVGDGEFDGVTWQATLNTYGWEYVCRTAKNVQLGEADTAALFPFEAVNVQPGECIALFDVTFTQQAYGPVLAIAWWDAAYKQPLYLVSNMALYEEACHWYRRRYRIETFFSDQKSRGFNLQKSHLADPERLARLLIATCLAYIWIVYLGVVAQRDKWVAIIHRTDRCDLSLFQLGLELLEHFLNDGLPIPVAFKIPAVLESVR
jgi:hypothetical protein